MNSFKSNLIVLGSVGLLFLGACSNGNQAANTENNPVSSSSSTQSSASTPSASPAAKTEGQHGESHGGQIVETGAYHLEFVPEKEANRTHMDFYLQRGDNHEAIPDAKVTAQVQLPDGTEKTVPFTYDAKDKHYTGLLSEKATGQYQVKVTADVKGEKVNGLFNFNQ
ncbi:hypothetical protein [Scytonema sp. PCC 10023]|uniref:hypothetical protein n=1 Tax=Scytonema sp. PCC 10023 TaxID=1680591 RepID=UPI0039C5E878